MPRYFNISNFIKMPWKNGMGETLQIAIFPDSATLEKNDFQLRISSAPILTDGQFSIFEGKKRILIPISGNGFSLNGNEFKNFQIAEFSGEDSVYCKLIDGPVQDLGLIYDSKEISLNSKVIKVNSDFKNTFKSQTGFIILLQGRVKLLDQEVRPLETVYFENEAAVEIRCLEPSMLLIVEILS